MQVFFGFYLASQVSFGFYREHAWATWDRLRASPASAGAILLGKIVVPLFEAGIQFLVLFGLGGILLGLHVRGPWVQLPMVAFAFSLCLVALGLAVTAVCRSVMQVNAIINISALLFACLGGALVPESLLPHWAKVLSPAVPSYWAMKGFRRTILDESGGELMPIAVLLGFAAAFALIAVWRLRFDQQKTGFS
jgi:ABC-2 type transport system permease protein